MTFMVIQYAVVITLPPMEFLYTCCTYLYRSLAANAVLYSLSYVSHRLTTQFGKTRSTFYIGVYNSE